jgi:Zn ribbon nucleic-acid-binding protein
MGKPKFYQAKLIEVKDVLKEEYPLHHDQITMTERMGSEDALCPECKKNHWFLFPKECVAVREGGKPYVECLNCGYQTHL